MQDSRLGLIYSQDNRLGLVYIQDSRARASI